jgi:hypothetical protein
LVLYRATTGNTQRSATRLLFKALALWLVAFYILAAGRGAIPGICATNEELRQIIRIHEQTPTIHALKSCCMAFGKSGGQAPPAHAACPFCKLLSVSFDPPLRALLTTPPELLSRVAQLPPPPPCTQEAFGPADGRAPPACA